VGTYIRHAPDMPNGFMIMTSYPRDEKHETAASLP
jgi:hypothetical protein